MRTPCDDKTLGVLGYIRQKLRKNGHLRIFGEYSELKDNRTRLYGNEFYVFANSGSYLTFAEPESMKIVQGILDELGAGYKLRVEKPARKARTCSNRYSPPPRGWTSKWWTAKASA